MGKFGGKSEARLDKRPTGYGATGLGFAPAAVSVLFKSRAHQDSQGENRAGSGDGNHGTFGGGRQLVQLGVLEAGVRKHCLVL